MSFRWPAFAVALLAVVLGACAPEPPTAGEIEGPRLSEARVQARDAGRRQVQPDARPGPAKQVLFGDLHVHSTFSVDAFMFSLPFFSGEGAHPPADACDFARYCSGLDFFSINDHAESLSPSRWMEIKRSIRQCNELAGSAEDPDLVAFTGWEWTQTGRSPETHFGHKNVLFPGLSEDELPARPISSLDTSDYEGQTPPPPFLIHGAAAVARVFGYSEYAEAISFMGTLSETPPCESGVNTRELPLDCAESAASPEKLFAKLDEWGFESLVIPHGLAWGIHAPPGARLDVQLRGDRHDPARQRLIEISSGHGNSEEFRDYPEYATDDSGHRICPAPTPGYLPCCWRAGEIMRERCGDLTAEECERRVEQAKSLALEAGVSPDLVFPDTTGDDWLDCDQCRDCFKPAMTLRPGMTAQYGAAVSNFEEDESTPRRFRFGFISSTDNHAARPGTGYKQYERRIMTDSRGMADAEVEERVRGWLGPEQLDPQQPQAVVHDRLFELIDTERKASFMYPGGVVAVHAEGRDRRSIWDALMRREVYGTSGPRILLWFDLLNAPGGAVAMGSDVAMQKAPRFSVHAVGAFRQLPGCPEDEHLGLSAERIAHLCRDECYHPSDERHLVKSIEVVRIRPQQTPGEPIAPLVEDPWLRFDCPADPAGCRVEFEDADFPESGRDAVYYVRALQEATPAINADGLRPRFDSNGHAVEITQCEGGFRTPADDQCLAPAQERAWSSPIYVDRLSES
ncbi:DUF3604 domain-containing protein [Myxococcota bacterium]|nr:DUF3604 domain-containing protein [Myxococcota bacterium]